MPSRVLKGDCLSLLPELDDGSVKLIYVDPPFFTQRIHRLFTRDRVRAFSFADLWSSQNEYATFLYDRLVQMYRVLASNGSIFFHCDRNATHLARVLLDNVFGSDNLRSEVIWYYKRWSNSRRGLLPAHQTIYYYTKSDTFIFNPIWQDYSPSTNVDQILQQRCRDAHNKSVYKRDEEGNTVPNGGKKGVPLSDVWEIPYLNPKARERIGYPTQKPLLLLERILRIATNEGDLVLDPFCGSGTTLVAAMLLNRDAIGMDTSDDAIELAKSRLQNPIKSESALLNLGYDAYRNADERALALLDGVDCVPVHRNKGIDAILKEDVNGAPVTVRVQRDTETLSEAAHSLYAASRTKNAKVMFLLATEGCHELELGQDIPPGVIVIESPASSIRDHLTRIRRDPACNSTLF